jgi:hypothetical protein
MKNLCSNCVFDQSTCPGIYKKYNGKVIIDCDAYTEYHFEFVEEEKENEHRN